MPDRVYLVVISKSCYSTPTVDRPHYLMAVVQMSSSTTHHRWFPPSTGADRSRVICETLRGRHDVSVRIRNDLETATRMINPLSRRPLDPDRATTRNSSAFGNVRVPWKSLD